MHKRHVKQLCGLIGGLAIAGGSFAVAYTMLVDRDHRVATKWGSPYQAAIVARSNIKSINIAGSNGVETRSLRTDAVRLISAAGQTSTTSILMDPTRPLDHKFKLWQNSKGEFTGDNLYYGRYTRLILAAIAAVVGGWAGWILGHILASIVFGLIALRKYISKTWANRAPAI